MTHRQRIAIETLVVAGLAWCGPVLSAQSSSPGSSNPGSTNPTSQTPSTSNPNPSQANPGSPDRTKPGEPQSPSGQTVTPGSLPPDQNAPSPPDSVNPKFNRAGSIDNFDGPIQSKPKHKRENGQARFEPAESWTESASANHTTAGPDNSSSRTLEVSHQVPSGRDVLGMFLQGRA